jgi:hypothetical protein
VNAATDSAKATGHIRTVNREAVWAASFVLVIAIASGIAGVISYRSASDLVEHGQHTSGQVVAFVRMSQRRTGGPHPVFVFTALDGRQHRVVSDTYSIFAPHYIGDTVPVVYYARAPEAARIEDGSSLYGLAFWCAGVACFCLCFAVAAIVLGHRTPSAATDPYIHANGPKVTFDLSRSQGRWGIHKGHRLRFALWSCALLSLPIIAAVVGDRAVFIVVAILALGFEGFLLLFSSLPNHPKVVKAMRVTNSYSRGYLWFQGIFWSILIVFVVWRLWVQFPR